MKTINAANLFAFGSALLPAPAAFAGLIVSAPVDVIGNLPAAQFTGLGYGTNAYKDWGNEPFVAVNPTNTNDVFISSFAYSTNSTSAGANVFYSTTGGASWTAQFSVPAPSNGVTIPNDWNFAIAVRAYCMERYSAVAIFTKALLRTPHRLPRGVTRGAERRSTRPCHSLTQISLG